MDPCEIIQIPNCMVGGLPLPDGRIVLMFTLPNGRQFQFPLDETGRDAVLRALRSVPVYQPGSLPNGKTS